MSKATSAFIIDQKVTTQSFVPVSLQTLSGNDQVIEMSGSVVRVDAGGSARTGAILQKGREAGQLCYILNEGAEVIDLAIEATSNVAGASGSVGFQNGQAYIYVWDVTNSLWVPAGNILS